MPEERHFEWSLKTIPTTHFEIVKKENGQFCVVLNHSLLRGCTSEMIHWWFLHFAKMKVKLIDIPGYESKTVPAYYLWHPSDHYGVSLSGELGPGDTAKAGASIHIQEAMQYLKHGWKYPVDNKLKIFYCGPDGWAMGKAIPFLGKVMVLRIHYKDVYDAQTVVGVHYHYEIVIGAPGNHALVRFVNQKIGSHFSTEFFEAWHLHNVIEVGTFENFLPALFAQRDDRQNLAYSKDMNPIGPDANEQVGFDQALFEKRVQGYRDSVDAHEFQGWEQPTFLV